MKYATAVPIGSGGMGDVYRAWDPDLQRHVALKYLRHDDPVLVERLMREARAQARVDHPSVCEVYEVGEEEGRPYIAMEYVDGEPLDVAAAKLTLEKKVLLVKRVTEAVQAAHAAGLVHRDLKPANILVTDRDGDDHPFVLDFGIARIEEVAGLTVTGQVMGTPGYLSPEQACGNLEAIDRRTDVFSLGIILYELLGGAKPFDGDSDVEVLVKLIEDEPIPLRRRAPHVPRDLNTIVMTCLEKEAERRYGSARALADDLDRFLRGEPVQARRTGFLTRVKLRARKNPRTTTAALVAVAALTAMAGLVFNERRAATRRAEIAQTFGREVERMEGQLEQAYLLPLHDIRPEKDRVRERMSWIDDQIEDLDSVSRALGHFAVGRGHLALGEFAKAHERLLTAQRLGDSSPELSYALGLSLAELYTRAVNDAAGIRDPHRRESALERAARTYRDPARNHLEHSLGGTEHPLYLAATLSSVSDDHDGALAHLVELRREDPFFYKGDLLAGSIHRQDFVAASRAGDSTEAGEAFDRARAAFAAATRVGESDPRPYKELCGLWVIELRNRHWASGGDLGPARSAALDACDKALIAEPDFAAAHIEAGRIHRFWAVNELQKGRQDAESLAAARRHARAAIDAAPDNHIGHVLLGLTHRIAARFLADRGNDPSDELQSAVAAYREAVRLDPADSSAPMSLASALLYLGDHKRGQGEESDEYFRAAAEAAEHAIELEPEALGAYVNAGIAHAQLGVLARERGADPSAHFDRGVAALERAIELNPSYLTAHFNLGEMLIEAAIGEQRRGLDPEASIIRGLGLLGAAAEGFPTWAAPHYLRAEGLAILAEHERLNGGDPGEHLDTAGTALESGRKINPNDATGLSRSSLVFLVGARWRLQGKRDPTPAITAGLEVMDAALRLNPNQAPAHLRRAELLLLRATWHLDHGRSPAADLDGAERSSSRAAEINPRDAGSPALEASVWRRRAEWQLRSGGDPREAVTRGIEAVERSLAIDPNRAQAWVERTYLELMDGDHEAAVTAATEARRLDPHAELPQGVAAVGSG